jgi:LAO/AO transport system kinase
MPISPEAIRQGDRLALTKALTAVENGDPESRSIQAALFPFTGDAHLIGVTGAPGTGKSTLVNQLAKHLRQTEPAPKIAIIAVDPTSPFTGGALLGDRIRMGDLSGDKGIFIRSMASRGALGGLAHATAAFATILDGAGFDLIIIETVGAGQAEVNIAGLAHTVIVVEAPGLGDEIQAIKAGILEIADILVVNKADRPGAENTARALKAMLEMSIGKSSAMIGKHMRISSTESSGSEPISDPNWLTPVQLVTASEGTGVNEVVGQIIRHRNFLKESGGWQEKENYRLRTDLKALIQDLLLHRWKRQIGEDHFEKTLDKVIRREITPIDAAEYMINQ